MEYILLWLLTGSFAYNIVLTAKVFQINNGPIAFNKSKLVLIAIVILSMLFGPVTFMMLRQVSDRK